MTRTAFEQTRPDGYLTRLAESDLGQSYKSLATDQLGIHRGDVVLDLGCGPGADLSAFARAAGSSQAPIDTDCSVQQALRSSRPAQTRGHSASTPSDPRRRVWLRSWIECPRRASSGSAITGERVP